MPLQSSTTPQGINMMQQMGAAGTARKGREESGRQANMQTAESRRASQALEGIQREKNQLTARGQEINCANRVG